MACPPNTAPPVKSNIKQKPGVMYTFHRFEPGINQVHTDLPSTSSLEHTKKLSTFQLFNANLDVCRPWISLEKEIVQCVLDSGFVSPTDKPLIDLEDSLFHMATYPNCCEGVFYCSFFQVKDCMYIRFLEAGVYTGCFPRLREELTSILPRADFVWWQVYNHCDIKTERQSKLQETR